MNSLLIVGLVLPVGLALAQNSQPAGAQSGNGTQAQSKQSPSAKTDGGKGNPAELKTQNYTGMLIDASCGAGGSAVTSSNTPSSSPSTSKKGEASRAEQASPTCAASAKTTAFGLRMKDGHVMRFDAVGNERATEMFSAKKKWADASAAGKDIQATVNGTESGDTLTVLSIR